VRSSLARLLVAAGDPTAALVFAETAFNAYANAFGSYHPWTRDSARVTAEALEALGRNDDADAVRRRYALTKPHEHGSEPATLPPPISAPSD
jgi:hypothetical protein